MLKSCAFDQTLLKGSLSLNLKITPAQPNLDAGVHLFSKLNNKNKLSLKNFSTLVEGWRVCSNIPQLKSERHNMSFITSARILNYLRSSDSRPHQKPQYLQIIDEPLHCFLSIRLRGKVNAAIPRNGLSAGPHFLLERAAL